jgi:hypothetical protein
MSPGHILPIIACLWAAPMTEANGDTIITEPWDNVPPHAEPLIGADFTIQPGSGWRLRL